MKRETEAVPVHVYEWACAMLGVSTLPDSLVDRLGRIQLFVSRTGGGLRSRQAVALVVEEWERDHDPVLHNPRRTANYGGSIPV